MRDTTLEWFGAVLEHAGLLLRRTLMLSLGIVCLAVATLVATWDVDHVGVRQRLVEIVSIWTNSSVEICSKDVRVQRASR